MQTKRMTVALYAALGVGAMLAGGTGLLAANTQQRGGSTEPKCKMNPVGAIRIAQGKVPGRALHANFEYDEGKWVYGVMVVSGKTIKEVTIDPMTGKASDVETVTPEDEAKEIRDELMKAIGGKVSPNAGSDEQKIRRMRSRKAVTALARYGNLQVGLFCPACFTRNEYECTDRGR